MGGNGTFRNLINPEINIVASKTGAIYLPRNLAESGDTK